MQDNTTENVLRFIQVRPPLGTTDTGGDGPVELSGETQVAKRLAGSTLRERRDVARSVLADDAVEEFLKAVDTSAVTEAVATVLTKNGSVEDLRKHIVTDDLAPIRDRAGDLLLAIKYAGGIGSSHTEQLETVLRAADALLTSASGPLKESMARRIALPGAFRTAITARPDRSPAPRPDHVGDQPRAVTATQAKRVLDELLTLARPSLLHLPSDSDRDSKAGRPFTLNDRGSARLTSTTHETLARLDLDPRTQSLDSLIAELQAEVDAHTQRPQEPGDLPKPIPDPPTEFPYLKDVGIADLLVVKQHLKRYERTDIAHVENVLAGEKKSRTHRALERIEETITVERETIQEKQTELETAERFELNREMARTVQRDQEFGQGLTISGKYGPSVEFTANLQSRSTSSTEESARSATRYAKDVVERSLERVVERVREEQVRRILREEEETNLHELVNDSGQHRSGVYQFLEKVYESQVFNYGIRQMFDFMVPEPASYLWFLEQTSADLNLPMPPPRLQDVVPDARAIDETNVFQLAAQFGVDGIEPPPPAILTATGSIVHGQDADDEAEEGQPRSVLTQDLTAPEGYKAFRALVNPVALTDDNLTLAVTVGHVRRVWRPLGAQQPIGSAHELGSTTLDLGLLSDSQLLDTQSKLPVQIVAYETNSYAVSIEVHFLRTLEAFQRWQVKTYDKFVSAHRDAVAKYEAEVADLKAAAQAEKAEGTKRFGAPPSQNLKTIKSELKKHCISIVTRQRYEDFDVVQDTDPPSFDFDEAAEKGSFTRFFEQAFEWDQLQYVTYPYYWAKGDRWADRFLRSEVDPTLQEFLQAGAARVVVPVRPGFEIAVTHFLETLVIWDGQGEPPDINEDLYVPIVTEIQERTGAPQGEVAVGEPWLTRVPTPLAILRTDDSLPAWQRSDEIGWDWTEV